MPHSTRRRIARAGDAEEQARRDAGAEARQFAGGSRRWCNAHVAVAYTLRDALAAEIEVVVE
jgi:hypothetical protein